MIKIAKHDISKWCTGPCLLSCTQFTNPHCNIKMTTMPQFKDQQYIIIFHV